MTNESDFERDNLGNPIFPGFDPENETAAAGRATLTRYIEALWGE